MPSFVLIVIAALAGLIVGYLARGIRARPAQLPARGAVAVLGAPRPPDDGAATTSPPAAGPHLQPVTPDPDPDPAEAALRVAREVLEVADHLENAELVRRLVEATVLLPGVRAVRPEPGDGFEPLLHEWAGNQITDKKAQWDTIAETLAPGAITTERALLRPAHVIVFEPPEQS
jgi:hypothetical protein